MDSAKRSRNPRGEGHRLREEIVTAAAAILEETGSEDAVTLRAVARRVGVSAPALYDHFTGPGAILSAVLERAFAQFHSALEAAAAEAARRMPRRRLEALAAAYLQFARDQPQAYRTMFDRRRREGTAEMTERRPPHQLLGTESFGLLADAVARAAPDGDDPMLAATALWVSLHGYATLRDAVPAFPWPAESDLLPRLLTGL